jgi:calcineurin-like phosphoesterase family protein
LSDSLIYVISDLHLGHEKCCTTFKRNDGTPLRPFANADEMDSEFIKRWNAVVRPQDKVYVLGDVAINERYLDLIKLLNGKLRLIGGNHDIFRTKAYLEAGFKEIRGVRVFRERDGMPNCVLTHVPIHPDCLARWGVNVHGHLHANLIRRKVPHKWWEIWKRGKTEIDPRYVSACVEMVDYTPILLTELVKRAGKQVGDTYSSDKSAD